MNHRNIEIKVRLNRKEAEALNKKVKKSRISREAYLRHLINGVVPQDAPPPEYFDFMRELHRVGNNLNQIAQKAHVLNVIDDDTIRPEHLPDFLFNEKGVEEKALPAMQREYAHQTLQETMDEFEGKVLRLALKEYNYNITQTAQALGIHRQGLQYRIKKYGIII